MTSPAAAVQPEPKATPGPAIWALVIQDMETRDRVGREKYGVPLQAGNGRDALLDLYQELLDAVVYTRQALEERAQASQAARKGPATTAEASGEGLRPTAGLLARLGGVLDAMTKDGCGLTGHQERALREALELPRE